MHMENLIDTILNIWVFAFVGILIWLYFRKEPPARKTGTGKNVAED